MTEYPIMGEYRNLLFTLETIVFVIFLELSLYFFYKYSQKRKEGMQPYVELNWAIIFLTFSIGMVLFIFEEYLYVHRPLFLSIAYLCFCVGGAIFSYRAESSKELKTKYFFTILCCITPIAVVILFFVIPTQLQSFSALMATPAYILLILYFSIAIRKIWGHYKLLSIGFLVGIVLWLGGFALTSQIALDIFGTLLIRVIGNILMIIGTILFGVFLTILPSLDEIGWQDKIKYIILTTHSGKCLYNENIRKKKEINEVLLGGYLTGLQIFIKTMMKDDSSLKSISKEKEAFLIEEGKDILAIMIVEKELHLLQYHLKKLVQKFEEFFKEPLANWKGDSAIFKPTKHLLREIIPLEKK